MEKLYSVLSVSIPHTHLWFLAASYMHLPSFLLYPHILPWMVLSSRTTAGKPTLALSLSLIRSIGLEFPGKSSSHGCKNAYRKAWPWPTALSSALCSRIEPNNKAFVLDKQMGRNWQGARNPYKLISVYSAVSKENFISKEHHSLGFATTYLLTVSFSPIPFTRGTNRELYFQLWRKIIWGQRMMNVRPFTKRQITSDAGTVLLTCFYVSIIHCAASGIVIEGKQVTLHVGSGILHSLQGNLIEKGRLRSSWAEMADSHGRLLLWVVLETIQSFHCIGKILFVCYWWTMIEISNKLSSDVVFQQAGDHNHILLPKYDKKCANIHFFVGPAACSTA